MWKIVLILLAYPGLACGANVPRRHSLHWGVPSRLLRRLRALPAKLTRLARSLSARQAQPDDAWALAFLNPGESRVYRGLDPRDREHACRITRALLAAHPGQPEEVIAAALLHDSGKSGRPYRVWERVAAGLVPLPLARCLPLGAVRVRAHHPELGAALLRRAGARPRVAELVARHHAPGGDAQAALLHRFDDLE